MQCTYYRFLKTSLSIFFLFPFAVFRPGQGGCAQRYDAETVSLLHSPGFLLANSWAPLQRPDLRPQSPPGSMQGLREPSAGWPQPSLPCGVGQLSIVILLREG